METKLGLDLEMGRRHASSSRHPSGAAKGTKGDVQVTERSGARHGRFAVHAPRDEGHDREQDPREARPASLIRWSGAQAPVRGEGFRRFYGGHRPKPHPGGRAQRATPISYAPRSAPPTTRPRQARLLGEAGEIAEREGDEPARRATTSRRSTPTRRSASRSRRSSGCSSDAARSRTSGSVIDALVRARAVARRRRRARS